MRMIKAAINLFKLMIIRMRSNGRVEVLGLPKTHLLPKIYIESKGRIRIGRNLAAEKNTCIESYADGVVTIGDNVFLNSNVKIVARKEISIGDNTVIAPNVCIYDHDHNWRGGNMQGEFVSNDIDIGKNVWIGANSVILCGSEIGDNCVVAAGTVVKGIVKAGTLFYQERVSRTRTIDN